MPERQASPRRLLRRHGLCASYWRWHLSRSLIGTTGIFLHFFAIATLPLAAALNSPPCRPWLNWR